MLEIQHLTKRFVPGGPAALVACNIRVPQGAIMGLLGPSGSGKTTLLRLIMGFMPADDGTIFWAGEPLTQRGRVLVRPALRRFSIVFQEYVLLPHLNVWDNVALGLAGLSRAERKRRVQELLELFQLGGRAKSKVHELSGGQQQRVALARALAVEPRLLLMDEPFSNIDPGLRMELAGSLRKIIRDRGITTILVTHDHREAFYFSDTVCVLHEGRVMAEGSSREIYNTPSSAWVAAFVGEVNRFTAHNLRVDLALCPVPDLKDQKSYLVRPEDLLASECPDGGGGGKVLACDFMGPYEELTVQLTSGGTVKVWDFKRQGIAVGRSVAVALVHRSLLKEVNE